MSVQRRQLWTAQDEQVLRDTYATCLTANIARSLGRTISQVHAKAAGMGLKKSPELVSQMARERSSRADHGSVKHRFQPGIVPWNKGTKGAVVNTPAMQAHQFKPGVRSHTWVPVGSYRIDPGGYLQVKYADEPGPPNRRWKSVHRAIWEAVHGPVPAGHYVMFKHGRRSNRLADITLDAVELITQAENMRRNTIHNLPQPLADVSRLRGLVNRAINRRQKAEASS